MFLLKKQVIDTLVQRVTISKDRKINVEIRLDLLKILDQDAGLENLSPAVDSRRGGIYIRKRSPHHNLRTVLQSLSQMRGLDIFTPRQIRNCAR